MFQGFGDPARMIVGQSGDKKTMDNIRHDLYLDQPKWKQFVLYLNDVSPICIHTKEDIEKKQLKGLFIGGNTKVGFKIPYLRKSYQTKKNVTEVLMEALPGTLLLAIAAMLFATIVGIFLGVIAAVKKGTWLDTTAVFSSIAGISAPSFFMAIMIAYFFGVVLHPFTGLNLTGSWFDIDEVTGEKYLTSKKFSLACAHTRHSAAGHHYTVNAQCDARRIEPGLYQNRLCKRIEPTQGYFSSCLAQCVESCDHCNHRLVCRIIGGCFFR